MPLAPAEAPRPAKDEQIVYIKLSDLHAFKIILSKSATTRK